MDYWIKPTTKLSKEVIKSVFSNINPIENFGIYDDITPPKMKRERYAHSFCKNGAYDSRYSRVIKSVNWTHEISDVFNTISFMSTKHNNEKQVFDILDVGSGDFSISKIIYEKYKKTYNHSLVNLFALEPDRFEKPCNFPIKYIPKKFEELVSTQKFDLVTFIHSFYAIDCSRLKQAISKVKDDGILLIISSPLDSNFINQITHVVDEYCYHSNQNHEDASQVTLEDEAVFRSYAELTEKMIKKIYPPCSIISTNLTQLLSRDKEEKASIYKIEDLGGDIQYSDIFDSSGILTDFGWDIAVFFSHNALDQKNKKAREEISSDLIDRYDFTSKPDTLSAKTWGFIIRKELADVEMREFLFGL